MPSIEASRYVMRPRAVDESITAEASGLYRRTAAASRSVMRGLDCARCCSSSLRMMPNCWTMKESAPAWLRIACLTEALRPWMSDTTAMMEVTATMLPSTVISDRSLAPQMALSAMPAASTYLFTSVLAAAAFDL